MKIYLCSTRPEEKTHQWVSNMAVFSGAAEDNEATSIICNNFLSCFTYDELPQLLEKIVIKMLLNSELIIIQADISMLSQRLFREEIDTTTLNNILFNNGPIKSVCCTEEIESLISENLEITNKHFNMTTASVVIRARRVK